MSFDFALPLNQKDLLESSVATQYVVEEVYQPRQVADRVMGCKTALRTEGPVMILDHFESFYSLLHHFKTVDPATREIGWELLLEAEHKLVNQLTSMEEDYANPQTNKPMLNTLKMLCYLLCRLAEAFEADACKPTTDTLTGKGRGRKKVAVGSWDWEAEKESFLTAIAQLLHLEIFRLWDPPVVEEEFVNLISGCCYKMFENHTVSSARCQGTRAALIQVLGILVKRYNHALSASLKILQLLQHFEHVVSPMAQAVQAFVDQFGVKSVTNEIMRELGSMDPQDLARDNSGTRAYAAFLVEIAEKIPSVMLPSISVLLCHLDAESYTMRNGVLGVLGEIVLQVLSKDDLDKKAKDTRDQLLDTLEDHIHDVNAYVRTRVLKIWLTLCEAKAVPLAHQHGLLEYVIGRLHDKSAIVRKGAVQLIKSILISNPFAAKLPVSELQSSLEKEEEKLKQLMPEGPSPEQLEVQGKAEESWAAMEPGITAMIKEFTQGNEEDESISVDIAEDAQIESIIEEIRDLLDKSQYRKALSMLKAAMASWPDYELFIDAATDDESAEEEIETGEETRILDILKAAYIGERMPIIIDEPDFTNPEKLLNINELSSQTGEVANEKAANEPDVNEVTKQQVLVMYLKACVSFAKQVQQAVPVMCQLLGSKTPSDVMEAIEFFVTAYEFGVSNSMEGVRRMMVLVFAKEPGVKEAVVAAYTRLYLHVPGLAPRVQASVIVKNLMSLTIGATLGEYTSLEELVSEFMKNEDLPTQAIQILWEYFTMKHNNTTQEESRAALVILGMAARSDVNIVKSNIEVLVSVGLAEQEHQDFLLAQDTCVALLKLAGEGKPKIVGGEEPFRFPASHDIFTRLTDVLVKGLDQLSSTHWIPFAVQAITTIYRLSEHPDQICANIIKQLAKVIMKGQDNGTDQKQSQDTNSDDTSSLSCPSGMLSRFLALAGQVAFQQLVHLDVMVLGELKRRRNIQECKKEKEKGKNGTKKDKDKTQESLEDEMGLTGASAEDSEAEYIRKICETDVVTGDNLLSFLRPLIVLVCSNPAKYSDPGLRANAALALAQFMLVSSQFCESHLQLLFTILEKAPEPIIRANTIIAVGDLTFHFPNLIEPWTPNLYARLRDESAHVRKNTLMSLTHLILNDMVKVKGQIGEMATCIVDSDERIAALAKLFFFELAKKGNAIYNIMPDMISRLSDPDTGLPQDQFKTVMRYLFAFIQKDKQADALVEKLCHRFRATRTARQPQDMAFCLALLNYSEKGMRKLQENFACYADKLSDPEVFANFTSILSKAKKFSKPEFKVLVEDFEKNLNECHTKGMDDDAVAEKASKASAAANKFKKPEDKTAVKKQPTRGRSIPSRSSRNSKLNSADEQEDTPRRTPAHPASRSTVKRRGRHTKVVVFDSSDEDSDDLFDVKDSKENSEDDQDSEESNQENQDPSSPALSKPKTKSGKKKLLNTQSRTKSRRRPIVA